MLIAGGWGDVANNVAEWLETLPWWVVALIIAAVLAGGIMFPRWYERREWEKLRERVRKKEAEERAKAEGEKQPPA
jgi:hypothetical protein